ncbi:phosphatidylinositol transfer protein [Xylariaceae sp. AK1471]|nr:phosphatidylinositol transfer protein [Xylariaceae sp. AK1471]
MRAESVLTETGHLGNLTADQEKKLQQLWGLLLGAFNFDAAKREEAPSQDPAPARPQKNGAPADHQVELGERSVSRALADELHEAWLGMVKQENPDALLLRFLRARKWDVAQAFSMLNGAIIWRCKEAHVDEEILLKGEPWCAKKEKTATGKEQKEARDFLEQVRLGKVYIRGMDRRGRPVGYVRAALHKPGVQSQETLEKLVVQTIETVRCLFTPPNESFCVVFDLTGFSLSNMEWQPVKFIIRAFEANYPECLGSLLIHNAPWIFSGIWKIIRGLLDPVVAAKVDFTRSLDDLEKYIPRENIISSLGGTDNWGYEYHEPSEDEDVTIAQADVREKILVERREIAHRLLSATQAWIKHLDAGEREEAAIQEQLRSNEIEGLWVNYWKLDPYVRSRTDLDRTGVIRPDGSIDLYPERKAGTKTDRKETTADKGDAVVTAHQEVAAAG